jgi:hypothetical protein
MIYANAGLESVMMSLIVFYLLVSTVHLPLSQIIIFGEQEVQSDA